MRNLFRYIELRHFEILIAAAEHGSFRKAAIDLGVRESIISRRVQKLEDIVGVSLFHRSSRGVVPTAAGESLLERARSVLRDVSQSADDLAQISAAEEGTIRVGVSSSITSHFLDCLLKDFNRRHRGVRIELVDGYSQSHLQSVYSKRIDVAVTEDIPQALGCSHLRLWSERVFIALPENHPLSFAQGLSWESITDENFLISAFSAGDFTHRRLIAGFAKIGRRPAIQIQYIGHDKLRTLVKHGAGVTLLTESNVSDEYPGVNYRPLVGETITFSATWCCTNDNPALQYFTNLARRRSEYNSISGVTDFQSPFCAAPSQILDQ